MQKWSWQVLLEKSKADIDLIVALLRFFFLFSLDKAAGL